MYSHRQAAWRSAWTVGAILTPLLLVQLYRGLETSSASIFLPIPVAAAMGGILVLILAVSFGLGFRLAGIGLVGVKVIAITAAAYLIPVVLFASLPVVSHPVVLDLPMTAQESRHALVVGVILSVAGVIVALFVLPTAVAFGVARIARSNASVA